MLLQTANTSNSMCLSLQQAGDNSPDIVQIGVLDVNTGKKYNRYLKPELPIETETTVSSITYTYYTQSLESDIKNSRHDWRVPRSE